MYAAVPSWYWWRMQQASSDPPAPLTQLELAVAPTSQGDETTEPLLLTVKEAAALMRVGRDTTYALVSQRRIPCIKLGKQIRIPRKALIAHLEREALQQTLDVDGTGSER